MTTPLIGSGAPRLQRNWDIRAACNFIGGGSGTGLLLAATAALPAGWPYFPAGILAIALIGFGLSMVWLEIGRPFRALNVFLHPQTSWMSREALLALPLLAFAGATVIMDQNWMTLPSLIRLSATPFALTTSVLALAFLFSQARILRASQGVPAWREPSLQIVIIVTGIAEGLGLLLVLGLFIAASPVWIVVAATMATLARAAAWETYRHRVKLTAPELTVEALSRASVGVHLFGHLLAATLLIASLMMPSPVVTTAIAGLALFATGAWLKFVVVTRAAFTQGFSISHVPVRGRAGTALPRHG
jgi:phenylacetyl-CoA:acceptor oxidoreductase 26-kDa subunit